MNPKPKKIVWMSRHVPTASQIKELGLVFPEYSLHLDGRSFSSAAEIVKRFKDAGGDEMIVVAPLSVIRQIIRAGITPILAKMEEVPCTDKQAEVKSGRYRPRCYKFIRYEWVDRIDIVTRPVPHAEWTCTKCGSKKWQQKMGGKICSSCREFFAEPHQDVLPARNPTVLLNSDGTTQSIIKEKEK